MRVGLTEEGAALAGTFYAETCRRMEALPSGLSGAERDRPAVLPSRVVVDNEVPEVLVEGGAVTVPGGSPS
ncbi:hypothetical protein ACWGBH_06205 [Streptomyces massasporeus]